jgi:hypothetical protein
MERIKIDGNNMKHVQAYIDYRNIVGVDDGGKMMSEEEFEAYKQKVSESRKNHLYVYWTNSKGYECKAIGPESPCFCGHRFKAHNFDDVKGKKVKCKTAKCKCALFEYIPVYGSNDIKCLCKHSYSLHDNTTRKCSKCQCSNFGSKFTCNCTMTYDDHYTIIETREERQKRGKAVDPGWMNGNLAAGIGGLSSFQGMVNDVYELEYKALMNDPDKKHMLMGDFMNNSTPQQNGLVKKNNITTSAFELFNKPHKYKNITKGINRLSIR